MLAGPPQKQLRQSVGEEYPVGICVCVLQLCIPLCRHGAQWNTATTHHSHPGPTLSWPGICKKTREGVSSCSAQ